MTRQHVPTGQYPIDTDTPTSEPLSDEQLEAITGGSFLSRFEHTLHSTAQQMQKLLGSTVQTIDEGVDFVIKSASTLLPK